MHKLKNKYIFLVAFFYTQVLFAETQASIGKTIQEFAKSVPWALDFLSGFSVVAGVVMIFIGLFKLKGLADFRSYTSGQTEVMKAVAIMVIGGMFVWMPFVVDVMTYSFFGAGVGALNRGYPIQSEVAYEYVFALTRIIQAFGIISFIRGFFILSTMARSQPQPGTLGKAMTHIIAGVLMINIIPTVRLVENTFDINFSVL